MRLFGFLFAFATACSTAAEHADKANDVSKEAAGTVVGSTPPATAAADTTAGALRALYVNRWASQSRKRMAKLIAVADSTEINALVIDMKDEFGLNYKTQNPEFKKNAGSATTIANLSGLLDTLKAHNIFPIARIVVFKDSVT